MPELEQRTQDKTSVAGSNPATGQPDHGGFLRQAQYIQNQSTLPIAHDGGAGKAGDPFQLFSQRLDHDLFGIVDIIHYQAEGPAIGLQHHDIDRPAGLDVRLFPRLKTQFPVQVNQRQQVSPQAVNRRSMDHLDALLSELKTDHLDGKADA